MNTPNQPEINPETIQAKKDLQRAKVIFLCVITFVFTMKAISWLK